jgi:hypothetical protein
MRKPLSAAVLVVLPLVSQERVRHDHDRGRGHCTRQNHSHQYGQRVQLDLRPQHGQQRRLGRNQRLRQPMSGLCRPDEQSRITELTAP